MGSRAGAREATPNDGHHDVYVRQRPADLLDYDGSDGIQESFDGTDGDELDVPEIRERGHGTAATDGEGGICGNADTVVGSGCMESKSDGIVAVCTPSYVSEEQEMCSVWTNRVRRTTRSDWLAWESARDPLEYAIPAF